VKYSSCSSISNNIDGDEYRNLKLEAEKTIGKIEAKLKDLKKIAHDQDVFGIVDKAIENLKNIAELYKNANMEDKQFIIGSIFPKKFVFDGEIDRTAPMNLAFHLPWKSLSSDLLTFLVDSSN